MIDKHVGERYILQDILGSGGMGTVYKGLDAQTKQLVAIKQLHTNLADEQLIERFKREGEALRELNHPNIVKMLDAIEEDGKHFLVMEFVSGSDLSYLLKQEQLAIEQILNIAIDLADALTRAHRLNIIHRDLKPANILIGDDGILRLTDFGVAYMGSKERVTDTDAIVGTIDYLPPEAFDGSLFDERGDIWAFGVILFEMLMGERPFGGETLVQVIQSIMTDTVPDIETQRDGIPIALIDLVYRMLERSIDERIPSVRSVGTELEHILVGREQVSAIKRFATPLQGYSTRPKHNLPTQPTPFIGREHELAELDKLLKDQAIRLITILAQGGMGKTRLALELAQLAVDQGLYPNGVYFVELAPLSDPDNILNAIADAAGYQFLGEGTPKEQLMMIIQDRNLLLVMDNYEHLPEGFSLIGDIIKSAPQVHVIATSRQRLSQAGEALFHLSGMDFPDWETPDDALEYAAIKLFMNSAKRVRPEFELTAENLDVVAQICKLVEGMPLGIILAASWLAVLSLSEIVDEIQGGLDFLETDETELPERHRNIRAVMDYSWAQMTEAEQDVCMKLSVFRGGFTREAGQEVAGANLRILMSLVNKSLIRRNADNGRYTIHELLRQYADGYLQQSDELDEVNDQHMNYFANFLAIRTPDIKGKRQLDSLHEIQEDFNNISIAWDYASKTLAFDMIEKMMECLAVFFWIQGIPPIATELFEVALSHTESSTNPQSKRIRNRLRVWQILWHSWHREGNISDPIYAEAQLCLQLAEQVDDRLTIFLCLIAIGDSPTHNPNFVRHPQEYDQALNLSKEMGDLYYEALVLGCFANYYTHINQANKEATIEYTTRHLEIARAIGDREGQALAFLFLSSRTMDLEETDNYMKQAIVAYQQIDNVLSHAKCTAMRSNILFLQGKFSEAKEILLWAIDALSDLGFLATHSYIYMLTGKIESIQGDYEASRKSLDRSLTFPPVNPRTPFHIYESMTLRSIGLNDFISAQQYVSKALEIDFAFIGTFHMINFLPQFSFLYHHNNQNERAVAILGLTFSHPIGITLWMDKWDLLTQLRAELKDTLGEESYNLTWERGKSLNLEAVVQELISEFGDSE